MTPFYANKDWYKSKTILGSVVTVILGVLSLFGIAEGVVAEPIVDLLFVVSGIFTGYGRVVATEKIGSA
jgi:hypothetical protein